MQQYKEELKRTKTENTEKDRSNARLRGRNIGLKMDIRKLNTEQEDLKTVLKRLQEENTTLRQMLRLDIEEQED